MRRRRPRSPTPWRGLRTDAGASFDTEITVDASAVSPMVTWGTTPGMVVGVGAEVPHPASEQDERALHYMGLEGGTPVQDISLDRVFIGSCTNSRIGDLRAAASMIKGRKVADSVYAMVVPGSQQVKAQAEAEGLDEVFRARRLRLAGGGLLDVPGDEPRHRGARRAGRLDLEPQLRGAPGRRRALAPRLASRWPPRPPSRATSSTSATWEKA